jgi:hypothetical protein
MTGLALQLPMAERTSRVARYGVLRAKNCKRCLIVMTGEAGVCALPAVRRLRRGVFGGLRVDADRYGEAQQQREERGSTESAPCYRHVVVNDRG